MEPCTFNSFLFENSNEDLSWLRTQLTGVGCDPVTRMRFGRFLVIVDFVGGHATIFDQSGLDTVECKVEIPGLDRALARIVSRD